MNFTDNEIPILIYLPSVLTYLYLILCLFYFVLPCLHFLHGVQFLHMKPWGIGGNFLFLFLFPFFFEHVFVAQYLHRVWGR